MEHVPVAYGSNILKTLNVFRHKYKAQINILNSYSVEIVCVIR